MTAAQDSPRPDLNLGLIGAGPWGRNYIRTLAGLEGVDMVRLCSRNPESAKLAGPGCEISTDWRQLIEAGDLDGVIIAAPPALQSEMMLAAIGRGLPVLAEKPMTLDPDRAEAVVKAAQSKGSIVLIDHIHLYSAAWETLKLEAQALGPLRAIATVAGNWGPFRADVPMLWDWGPHDVAMCIDLLGRPPEKVTARLIESRETEEGPGEALALGLGFGDVTARAAISNLQTEKTRLFTAVFEKGELVYDDTSEEKLRLRTDSQDPGGTFRLGDGTPLERAVLAFRDAIFKKSPDMKDAVMGRDVVRVLAEMDRHLG